MSAIKRIRKAVRERRVELSDHAFEEMDNDQLTLADIRDVLLNGSIHRTHENDRRGIQYLVRGTIGDHDVEVVCRFLSSDILRIITVYEVTEAEDTDD